MTACSTAPAPRPTNWEPFCRGFLARELRDARQAAGISQEAVASCLGMHHSSISEIERGMKRLADDRVLEIERFIGCRAGRLMEAAIRDRDGMFMPAHGDEQVVQLAALAVAWKAVPAERAAKIDEMRARLLAGTMTPPQERRPARSRQTIAETQQIMLRLFDAGIG